MAYRDAETLIASALAVSGASAVNSSDHLDLLNTNPNWGAGGKAELRVTVTTAFSQSASTDIEIEESTDGSTWTNLITLEGLAAADLADGSVQRVPLPQTNSRYIRGAIVPTGTVHVGTVDMDFVPIGA